MGHHFHFWCALYSSRIQYYVALEAIIRRCTSKQTFFKISQISHENTSLWVSFLIKLLAFLKETPTQASYKNSKMVQKIFFYKTHTSGCFCSYKDLSSFRLKGHIFTELLLKGPIKNHFLHCLTYSKVLISSQVLFKNTPSILVFTENSDFEMILIISPGKHLCKSAFIS